MSFRSSKRFAAVVAAVAVVAWVAAAASARSEANIYSVHTLVADTAAAGAPTVDASLVNGWGLSAGPTTPWWTSNNGSNTSTLYSGAGVKSALTVAVPAARRARCSTGTRRRSRSPRAASRVRRGSCLPPRAARSSAGRQR